ncbi:barstar family protein [Bacillus sp. NSP9.1]|uniref:barstar family protein n=1 Tax=Bacillus sp. NSP9.1 TaxID=1071078 RepID=UPI000684C089|nr:barstar family protein [Bacillus sp. NSP9.1]QHZ46487.1 barstar family protein [Bacillus sp. NSP9.1]
MKMLDGILMLQEPYIHLLVGEQESFDEIAEKNSYATNNESEVFLTVIEGNNCITPEHLMKEFAKKLKFPNYFGENWAAFDECINDLDWLDSEKYVLFIRNSDKLLLQNEEFNVFVDILNSAINEWVSGREYDSFPTPPTPFHVVLHCEKENEEKLDSILSNKNINKFEKIQI